MSSRSKILDAIKKNKPQLSPLPEIPEFDNETVDKVAFLNEVMSIIGGVLEEIKGNQANYQKDKQKIETTKKFFST